MSSDYTPKIDPNITDQERKCLRILAKLLAENKKTIRSPLATLRAEGLEVEDLESLDVLLRMMEKFGAIENVNRMMTQEFRMFDISPTATQLVRQLDAEEKGPSDIVDKISEAARKNRIIGWIIVVSIVLASILTIANQATQFAQNMGWMAKPK